MIEKTYLLFRNSNERVDCGTTLGGLERHGPKKHWKNVFLRSKYLKKQNLSARTAHFLPRNKKLTSLWYRRTLIECRQPLQRIVLNKFWIFVKILLLTVSSSSNLATLTRWRDQKRTTSQRRSPRKRRSSINLYRQKIDARWNL
jgi:hypothetical protein